MKRTASIILMILLSVQVFSQEILKIKKTDNTILTIPTSEIISLTFSSSEQLVDENTITDIDGNTYNILKIGLQSWTGKNLETTKFKNGEPIPKAGSEEEWKQAGKEGKPAWCYYLDASDNGKKYGILYNWYAVTDRRGLAPDGWRVSTKSDWDGLGGFLKDIPGAKLKEQGTSNWIKNTSNVTNETGFTALPGGFRFDSGKFGAVGSSGCWWTSDPSDGKQANYILISDYTSLIMKYSQNKGNGYSVRLVKE